MRKAIPWLLLTSSTALAQQYVISTYAGGVPAPTPAPALKSPIGSPQAIATDREGNSYFTSLNCVFKLDSSGTLTRIAGTSRPGYSGDGGPAVNAQLLLGDPYLGDPLDFELPSGVALDGNGNIYVADQGNNRVRRISTDGTITTVAGGGSQYTEGAIATSVSVYPAGLAVDAAGSLYISGANVVRKVSADGIIHTVAGTGSWGSSGDGGCASR